MGGLLGMIGKGTNHRTLCALVSFAAGALLSVTLMHIMPEAIELAGWTYALTSVAAGVLVFYFIGKYVSFICPACAASAIDQRTGYLRLGILLMIALGIHSTMDGLAIAIGAESSIPMLGVLILFAVSYHKIPEGLALTSVARLAGFSKKSALITTVLIELTTGLGAFIGLIATTGFSNIWLGILLAHAGGSFLYVVGFALITEWSEHERTSIVVYLTTGFIAIWLLAIILAKTEAFSHMAH
ncbi:MAG: ZIP family metal transporter [Armatimonadota bacterium]|nr:ZIP family metal transporter [Armatimonadota bacterium]